MAGQTGLSTISVLPARQSSTVVRLQVITLVWMLVECGVALYAAFAAHSPAMLAFGSDSLVELLSAMVVLLQFVPGIQLSERQASRAASVLLFALALVVAAIALLTFAYRLRPDVSIPGMCITVAALIGMPVLAWRKRVEARKRHNAALAADAVQSATCAYLAAITLAGLGVNAVFHMAWADSAAAILAVPLLFSEARKAWRGHACSCC